MNVCIVTLYDKSNIGNRLQNYAVQEMLKAKGCNVSTIAIIPKTKRKNRMHQLLRDLFSNDLSKRHRAQRQLKILKFNKRFINTLVVESISDLPAIAQNQDFFIVGSDQVWNSLWYFSNEDKLFLLGFADPEKRISLSASFGIDYVPEKWSDAFRNELTKFKKISVREYAGQRLIHELTGQESSVLIDPVLYFDNTFWRSISKPTTSKLPSKRYLLCYFIDSFDSSDNSEITTYAQKHNLEIVIIKRFEDNLYSISPLEFLWLIDNAAVVCTDSYHAYVFSFLFKVPSVYIDDCSLDMSSRIDSFIHTMGIYKNTLDNIRNDDIKLPTSANYMALEEERKKYSEYINESLEVI